MNKRGELTRIATQIGLDSSIPEFARFMDVVTQRIGEAYQAGMNEQREWQPIETAQKDGSLVWVYAAEYQDLPAFQSCCAYHPDAGWCVDELREVTHWMPLPPPLNNKGD